MTEYFILFVLFSIFNFFLLFFQLFFFFETYLLWGFLLFFNGYSVSIDERKFILNKSSGVLPDNLLDFTEYFSSRDYSYLFFNFDTS